ncbi:hypothetical protein HNQ71_006696 [Mesorhizobium sangaii]|uniref:Uncharacterized protein n=1 Tax=Mesorhizobium sangaii TaxID=505389 RepID=A0A841PFL6_9HYPH|nr:hypothetical protein [Mesorhizobium sangaii]
MKLGARPHVDCRAASTRRSVRYGAILWRGTPNNNQKALKIGRQQRTFIVSGTFRAWSLSVRLPVLHWDRRSACVWTSPYAYLGLPAMARRSSRPVRSVDLATGPYDQALAVRPWRRPTGVQRHHHPCGSPRRGGAVLSQPRQDNDERSPRLSRFLAASGLCRPFTPCLKRRDFRNGVAHLLMCLRHPQQIGRAEPLGNLT